MEHEDLTLDWIKVRPRVTFPCEDTGQLVVKHAVGTTLRLRNMGDFLRTGYLVMGAYFLLDALAEEVQ